MPTPIADFYREVGPRNIHLSLAGGNPTVLPALSLLWDHQVGFRIHGNTGDEIPDWPHDWLVIAATAADEAFVFDISRGCILHTLPGAAAQSGDSAIVRRPEHHGGCAGRVGTDRD